MEKNKTDILKVNNIYYRLAKQTPDEEFAHRICAGCAFNLSSKIMCKLDSKSINRMDECVAIKNLVYKIDNVLNRKRKLLKIFNEKINK